MKILFLFSFVLLYVSVKGQYGPFEQSFGYIDVREGAHMFYWLFYTTAPVSNYTERPLVIWLQGGPGGSSTGIGNFDIMGPLNLTLQERDYTWVNNFNVLYIDNPVGTGFSYVDDFSYLTTTNEEIAEDMLNLLRGFYVIHPEFEGVPLYMYGQSYGGKMVVDMALKINEAEIAGTVPSNLRGIAMGNAWISPVDATLTWGPLLLAAGLVDQSGYENIQIAARYAETLYNQGEYVSSTNAWAATQTAVFAATGSVDFYDITTKMAVNAPDTRSDLERARDMLIRNKAFEPSTFRQDEEIDLDIFMNEVVKPALNIPESVTWGGQSNAVFNYLSEDFMKPVVDSIERLLNETDIIVTKYNGNLDLICDTPGQLLWVERLKWPGAEGYRNAPRNPIWEDDKLEGYYKSYGNFRFFWINAAGHSFRLRQVGEVWIGMPYSWTGFELGSGYIQHGCLHWDYTHDRNTRNKNKLATNFTRLTKISNSFIGDGIRFYNTLPNELLALPDTKFKTVVKSVLCKKGYYKIEDFVNDKAAWSGAVCPVRPK